jgi:hypothetical protein
MLGGPFFMPIKNMNEYTAIGLKRPSKKPNGLNQQEWQKASENKPLYKPFKKGKQK